MAIEDSYILSGLLGLIQDSIDFPAVLQAYDAVRLDRTMKVVSTSRQCGMVYGFEDPAIGDDLELIDQNLRERYNWIWDEDIEGLWLEAARVFASSMEAGCCLQHPEVAPVQHRDRELEAYK